MNERERDELAALAGEGDRDAIQRLIVHYHPILRAKIAREISGEFARHIDAEDVLQHAYIEVFNSFDASRFTVAGGFYKWIEQIALNDLRDMKRGLRRQKRDVWRNVGQDGGGRGQGGRGQGVRGRGGPAGGAAGSNAHVAGDSIADLVQRLAGSDQTPSKHLARNEAIAAALSCLARLSVEQREVIQARYFEHEPVSDLAQRLGKTEQAIHSLCYRALRELRQHMGSISQYLSNL